jgi:hypothetical protein
VKHRPGTQVRHRYELGGVEHTRYGVVVERHDVEPRYEDGRPVVDRDTGEPIVLDRPRVLWYDDGSVSEGLDDDAVEAIG